MRCPAAIPALALAAGIAIGIFLPVADLRTTVMSGAAVVWAAALLAFLQHRPRVFVAEIVLGFALAGAVVGASANTVAICAPLGELFDRSIPPGDHQVFAYVEGTLRSDAARGPSGVSLSIDVDIVEIEGRRQRTSGGALIGVAAVSSLARVEEWRAGRRVRAPVVLRRPARYLDPGVADAQRDFGWKGTSLVGSAKSDRLVDVISRGPRLSETLAACRAGIRRAVSTSVAPWSDRSAAVVTAILIGDRAGLDDDMQRQLQEAGTYHVIAISGGNIGILAGLCVMVLGLCRAGPRASALIVVAILIAYALIVGAGASVGRATLMAAIYFAARFFDQRSAPGNVAAISAAALFCLNPLEIVDASFALTFGATLGLVIGLPRWRKPPWMPTWLHPAAVLFAASVCAEVALLPVSAFVFSRVTAAGLLLNFAAIPAMSVVQTAGMAATGLAALGSRGALWAGFIAHLGVRGLLWSASLVDLMPWMVRRVPPPDLVSIAGYYLGLVVALTGRGRLRASSTAATIACAIWIVAAPGGSPMRSDGTLRVTFIDVGQGDAALVQFPDGRSLSIDAGGLASASFDIGSRVVAPAYWALGLRRLDYMSISHGDPDHIGGAPSIFRDFHPREVWEGVPVPVHAPTQQLRALADRSGAPWRTLRSGDGMSFGAVRLTVHHPPPPDWERQRVRNDDSEVLEVRYGSVSFVFTGDIGREVERAIESSFAPAAVRILKVPHHGSATSSSAEFLRALRPDIAIVSAGRGNPFGHPVAAVLDRYRAIGAAIYRTDLDGAVTIDTDGRTVHLRTFGNRRLTLRTRGREKRPHD